VIVRPHLDVDSLACYLRGIDMVDFDDVNNAFLSVTTGRGNLQ